MDERARALKALGLFDRISKLDRETMDSDLSAYTDHMADQGTEAMEREKAAAAIKTAEITESEGQRQAQINRAEGEKQAAHAVLEAAQTLATIPEAMQLRYLNTLILLQPDSPQERLNRALMHMRLKKNEKAKEDVRWLLDNNPPGFNRERLLELFQRL